MSNFDDEPEDFGFVFKKLSVSSLQTATAFLLEWCPNLITIYFLGRIGRDVRINQIGRI